MYYKQAVGADDRDPTIALAPHAFSSNLTAPCSLQRKNKDYCHADEYQHQEKAKCDVTAKTYKDNNHRKILQ